MRNRRSVRNWKRLLAEWLCMVLFVVSIVPIRFQVRAAEIGMESGSEQGTVGRTQDEDVVEDADGDNVPGGGGENGESGNKNDNNNGSEDEGDNQENDDKESGEEDKVGNETGDENEGVENTGEGDGATGDVDSDEDNIENDGEDSEGVGNIEDGEIPDQVVEGIDDGKEANLDELLSVSAEERLALMSSEGDIASGTYEDIAWVIDGNGKLTVTGTGDFAPVPLSSWDRAPWVSFWYRDSITSAEINVTDMTDASCMFWYCRNLKSIDVSNFDTRTITNMSFMFDGCRNLENINLNGFDTGQVTDMSRMFGECNTLTKLILSNFNTSKVKDMGGMFTGCSSLAKLDVSNFDTSQVTNMSGMFSGCRGLTNLDVSGFDTCQVTNMYCMFDDCSCLAKLDVSKFNTGQVTDMSGMFAGCRGLTNLDVSGFDTGNVVYMGRELYIMSLDAEESDDMAFQDNYDRSQNNFDGYSTDDNIYYAGMFNGCSGLAELDLSNFNTCNVVDMCGMFSGCRKLQKVNLSSFNVDQVTYMSNFFYNCESLKTIYTPYNITQQVLLPINSGDVWYCSDSTTVTELPKNLSYSVALGRNYIPTEKASNQLTDSQSSIFLFRDAMTRAPIKDGRVCIEERFVGSHYYYPSKENGYVSLLLSKNCNRVFISTYFNGYEGIGGWTDLSSYRTESGIYVFDLKPRTDKYIPKLPSVRTSVTTSAPAVETDEGNISLFDMNMGFDMDFGKGVSSTVTYDEEERTIKVAISTDGKVSYDAIKKEYKASGSKSGKSLDEEFEDTDKKMSPGKFANVNVKMTVMGYLEFAESGAFIEGGAIVRVNGSGATEYRPVSTAGLAYAKFELGVSVEGKLLFTYIDGNLDASAAITLEPYAKIAVGAGWSLAHAEIGASGTFPIKIDIPYKSDKESLSIDADFVLYGEVKFFCFGGKRTAKVEGNIWPAMSFSNYSARSTDSLDIPSVELDVLPRTYLSPENVVRGNTSNTQKVQSVQNQSLLTSSDSFRYSEISEDQGVFAENNVQYTRLTDGTEILAWIHDFGEKSSVNRTTLVYSVNKNDGNGWGAITPICSDTSTGDYYPSMTSEGNIAYLVWNKASKAFDDDVDVDEVGKNIDVYVSVFESGAFSEPKMISDANNNLIEFSPKVAVRGNSAAVAWLINSENDYHYTKGNNSIYICEYSGGVWEKPVCYAQNLNYVSDYDIDYINGSVAVLYAEDADNRADTQDGTVYYVRNGKRTMIGESSYHAEIVDLCDGKMYFSGGSKIYKVHVNRPSYIYDTGIETDNFSVVKSISGDEAILFLKQDGFESNVCASYLRDGIYTSPVPIVSDGSRVTNYVPLYNDDGTISIAYNEDEISETSDYIYGLTDMVVRKNLESNIFSVNPILAYNAYDVVQGNTIEFATTVTNFTSYAVTKVNVSLTGSGAGEVYTDTLDVDIPIGGQQYVSISYTLPEQIVNQKYTLTVTPVDFDDSDLSDNSAVCELGFSDIAFSDLQIKDNVITGTVTNIGYQTAENVSLIIKEDNQENSPIAMFSYEGGNLKTGESWEFSQEVATATFGNVGEVKYYLLSAKTDSLENNYLNNDEIIYDEPIAPTKISFDQDMLSMTEKTVAVITAEVLPQNTTFKDVVYTSGDNSVAVVDDKGNVYAVGKGSTIVTAYTADGSQSATCEVTVDGLEEQLYTLSDRELELEIEDSSSICVMDVNGDQVESVAWSSTNEDVVTIDQTGNVVAKGEGIACLVSRVDSFTDVCIVRVSDHSILQLACEESTLQLIQEETASINIVVVPEDTTMEKALTYVSEDESIATVDGSGTVTAIGVGSTVITVSAVNGVQTKITVIVSSPVKYTVVFDTMGGTRVEPMEVAANKSVTEERDEYTGYLTSIPSTYKEGYVFAGWYIDKNGASTALSTDTPITGDVVYYAVWQQGSADDPEALLPEDIPEGGIPENFWIAGIDPQGYVYTGQPVKPQVRVYDGDRRLKEGQDYTISYKNNTKANDASVITNAPMITVKGKGNYSGTETETFKILPINLNDENIIATDITVAYNKKVQKKIPTVTYGGKKLVNKRDFTVSYPVLEEIVDAYKAVGTYDIVLTAKEGGNFTGERAVKLIIMDRILISSAKVSKIPDQYYTGRELKPEVTVTYKKDVLEEGRDYTLTYADNIEQGKAVVTLTGMGQYAGEKKVTFNIKGTSVKNAKVSGIENKLYDGTDQKQQLTVMLNNSVLTEGTDYEITYSNNWNVGKASVVIKGINAYSGTIKKSFRITAYDLKKDDRNIVKGIEVEITAKYTKGGAKPKPILTFDDQQLIEGKDYTIAYKNNASVTTEKTKKQPTITIKGKGNFKGTLTKTFIIISKDLNDEEVAVTMSVADKGFINKAGKYISKPILIDVDGKKLVIGKDYEKEITYSLEDGTVLTNKSIVPADSNIKVEVVGKGAYYGKLEKIYRIAKNDFSKAKIKITPQIYTGSPITLGDGNLTVKIGGEMLTYGTDYEIVENSYKNNKNKGVASVTLIGKSNYGGTRSSTFKITAKRFIWFWRLL